MKIFFEGIKKPSENGGLNQKQIRNGNNLTMANIRIICPRQQ